MSNGYFTHVRTEITPLLPKRFGTVLEIGCGSGATLRWLKGMNPALATTGVEYNAALSETLAANTDRHFIGPVEDHLDSLATYDLILCLDVLEHLNEPETVLSALVTHLAPAGRVIVSLPNVSHVSVSLPLLLRREFPYADAGILDRTHRRLFVERSAVELANTAGLHVVDGRLSGMQGGKAALLNRLTAGLFRHYLAKQYVFAAERGTGAQPPVIWRVLPKYPLSSAA